MMLTNTQSVRVRLIEFALRIGGEGEQEFNLRIEGKVAAMIGIVETAIVVQSPVQTVSGWLANQHSPPGARRAPEL